MLTNFVDRDPVGMAYLCSIMLEALERKIKMLRGTQVAGVSSLHVWSQAEVAWSLGQRAPLAGAPAGA